MTLPDFTISLNLVDYTAETLDSFTIRYGRERVTEWATAATLSARFLAPASDFALGDYIFVTATVAGNDYPRFRGRISSISADHDTVTVTATSWALGTLVRYYAPPRTYDRSSETIDEALVQAMIDADYISDAVTLPPIPLPNGRDFYYVTAATIGHNSGDVRPAGSLLSVLQTLAANDPYPHLYETPAGDIYFGPSTTRSSTSASWTLPANVVDYQTVRQLSLDGLVNRCVVTYTPEDATTGDYGSATITIRDSDSESAYGRRETSFSTLLVDFDDAALKASRNVFAGSQVYWTAEPTMLVNKLSQAVTIKWLESVYGTIVDTSAAELPPEFADKSYIEGWTETYNRGAYRATLYLSPYAQTHRPERWNEVSGTLAYNSPSIATYSWLDLIGVTI